MRYAIVSDIHANLQAWKATLLDIRSLGADRILCLGDLVGYGPAPAPVLESVYGNIDHVVLGNHDAAVCGRLDPCHFNDGARRLVDWTATQLNSDAMTFLQQLPLTLQAGDFCCAHGDISEPGRFHYIIDPHDALPSWESDPSPLMFVGHSHDPAIFVVGNSGTPHRVDPQDFMMEEGKRYIVNVGSVGQPRDGDARASYCMLDTDTRAITWRRIPFDIDAFRADMERASLDTSTSYFLSADPRLGSRPIREQLSFSPPTADIAAVDGSSLDIAVADLTKRARAWKGAATAIALCAFLVMGTGGVLVHRQATRARVFDATAATSVSLPLPLHTELLGAPRPTPDHDAFTGWRLSLGDHRQQSVHAPRPDSRGALQFHSKNTDAEIRLSHQSIPVEPGMKFCLRALIRRGEAFSGDLGLWVTLERDLDGGRAKIDPFTSKQPNIRRKEGWYEARETYLLPSGSESMEVGLRGTFSGRATVKEMSLTRLE